MENNKFTEREKLSVKTPYGILKANVVDTKYGDWTQRKYYGITKKRPKYLENKCIKINAIGNKKTIEVKSYGKKNKQKNKRRNKNGIDFVVCEVAEQKFHCVKLPFTEKR